MTKSDLDRMIQNEVARQLKSMLPALVKPLVQEAVAGGLAAILAEGIVKGAPVPAVAPVSKRPAATSMRDVLEDDVQPRTTNAPKFDRESYRSRLRREQESPHSIARDMFGNSSVAGILQETAQHMHHEAHVDSILDVDSNELENVIDHETVGALTRDYSALMARMRQTGKLNG